MEAQKNEKKASKSAQGEVEYWRQRAATFNTLFQQLNMPQVKKIIHVMTSWDQKNDGYTLDNYNTQYSTFQKDQAIAKDFVKFLNTLDRQFKSIHIGDLTTIEETIPSLLTGLKLIWTISRHINQNDDKFEDILESISTEICDMVRMNIDIYKIFKKPDDSIVIIKKAKTVLTSWKRKFEETKRAIEDE
jgi:dynein heavy chain